MDYAIADIFGPTLQGEGHFVGYPACFVRLAGCSVKGCHIRRACDERPWAERERLSAAAILERVRQLAPTGIVVITGGEPTDQDLVPLVATLNEASYRVHMETSGSRAVTGLPIEWLTVSPKTPDYAQRTGHTLKVVVTPEMTWDDIDRLDAGTNFFHRYLQPMTGADGHAINLPDVIAMVTAPRNADGRWALSTQAHRTWNVK